MNKLNLLKKLKKNVSISTKFAKIANFKEFLQKTNNLKSQKLKHLQKSFPEINLQDINPNYWIQNLQDQLVKAVNQSDPNANQRDTYVI